MGILGLGIGLGQTIANAEYNKSAMEAQHYYNIEAMEKSNKTQFQYNEMAAENADKRQRALYEDYLSYAAQVRQMKAAGLNPALMYGNGGSAGNMPSATQGHGANGSASGVQAMALQNADLAQIAANMELIKSQANKNEAEADNIRGINGTKGYYEIRKIIEETKGQTIRNLMDNIDLDWRNIKNQEEVNKLRSDIDSAFNDFQLKLQQTMLEYEIFNESKSRFDIERRFKEKELSSQENRFYIQIKAAEDKLQKEIDHSIEIQANQMQFESEKQKEQFKHDTKMSIMKTVGNVIGGGLGGILLKAIK